MQDGAESVDTFKPNTETEELEDAADGEKGVDNLKSSDFSTPLSSSMNSSGRRLSLFRLDSDAINETLFSSSPDSATLAHNASLALRNLDSETENRAIASQKRNVEFLQLFNLSEKSGEYLIEDFACAWHKEGRLYLTDSSLHFYAYIFGWTHTANIPLADVTSVEKRNVAAIIPNSIEITTISNQKYFFASFLQRDFTYDMILDVWNNLSFPKNIRMSVFKRGESVLPTESTDEEEDAPVVVLSNEKLAEYENSEFNKIPESPVIKTAIKPDTDKPSRADSPIPNLGKASLESGRSSPVTDGNTSMDWFSTSLRKMTSYASFKSPDNKKENIPIAKSKALSPAASTLDAAYTSSPELSPPKSQEILSNLLENTRRSSNGLADIVTSGQDSRHVFVKKIQINPPNQLDSFNKPSAPKSWEAIPPKIVKCTCENKSLKPLVSFELKSSTLERIWNFLYDDKALQPSSQYFKFLTEKRKCSGMLRSNLEIKATNWTFPFTKTAKRKVSYVTQLNNSLGPKQTRCESDEQIVDASKGEFLCVLSVSSTPDVPSGSCFTANTKICMHQSGSAVCVSIFYAVEWIKSSWLKMAIDSAVPDGLKEHWKLLERELREFVCVGEVKESEVSDSAVAVTPEDKITQPVDDLTLLLEVGGRLLRQRWRSVIVLIFFWLAVNFAIVEVLNCPAKMFQPNTSALARHQHLMYTNKQRIQEIDKLRKETAIETEYSILEKNHKFVRDEETEKELSWEERVAKKYYDRLFKEFALCNLKQYKKGKVALRWRLEKEVVEGKGQFECGNLDCTQTLDLTSWEVNFAYLEDGERKNTLVKIRLCPPCSNKLNYKKKRKRKAEEAAEDESKKRRKDESGVSERALFSPDGSEEDVDTFLENMGLLM